MNAVDILLILTIIFSVWIGWRRGAVAGAADLISWAVSLILGFLFYKKLGLWLIEVFPKISVWSNPFAFILIIMVGRVFLSIMLSKALPTADVALQENPINKVFGMIPGFINGGMNALLIAALLVMLPFSSSISAMAKSSQAVTMLSEPLQWFNEKLVPIFDPAIKKLMKDKAVYPDSKSTTKLNFTVPGARAMPNLEMQMLQLVNGERVRRGLAPLEWDPMLLPAARSHSQDMFTRGYFSHYSLEGKTVSDRLRSSKVRFVSAGENLALAQSIATAHQGLMNSPGHKANILHKSYGRVAIGVLNGGMHGLMITQVFKD